jgi:DNA-binding MarR family transcriptional regulator
VPFVNDVIGHESEIWSFSIDTGYKPMEDLELTISLSEIKLQPDDSITVIVKIENHGELKDTVTLNVKIPPDVTGIYVILPNPRTVEIPPGTSIELNFTINVTSNSQQDVIPLTVEIISHKAVEYGLEFDKSIPLTIKIIDDSDNGPGQYNIFYQAIFLLIIIIIFCILPIYIKVERENVFRNVLRRVIHKTIKENPGIHFREIMRKLSLKPGTLSYHLNILEKKSYVKSVQKGIYRCFYLANIKSDFKIVLSTLQQNILLTINDNPGITLTELSDTIGKNKMALNYHTHKLEDCGMIKKEKKGKIVTYSATSLAAYYLG